MQYTQEDLASAIALLSDADLEDNEIDQVDEIVIAFAEEKMAIEAIMDAEEDGEMSEEEADTAIAEIITTSAERRLEIFDLEIDLIEAPENYSNSTAETMTFSQAMGATISNLIAEDYNDPSLGKNAIANATGLSETDIDRLILGQAVPDTETANNLTACFSATKTDSGFKEFMNLAAMAQQEVAQFDSSETSVPSVEVLQNSNEINTLKAEFNALKQKEELGHVLRNLEKKADNLISNGNLTPWEKRKLFGETTGKEEGMALFSAACAANGVSTDTQVDRITYYLSVAQDRGQAIQFSHPEPTTTIDTTLDRETEEYTQGFINRNGII